MHLPGVVWLTNVLEQSGCAVSACIYMLPHSATLVVIRDAPSKDINTFFHNL